MLQHESAKKANLIHNSSSETGNIHDLRNYSSSMLFGNENSVPSPDIKDIKNKLLKPTHFDKHQVTSFDILDAFKEIEHENTSRLIGLISHFSYWVIFGHLNQQTQPLSHFHLKQLFISILQSVTSIEKRQSHRKKIFSCFLMPLVLLTIRLEIESIYRNTYPCIMQAPETEDRAMRLIN
jgi:hypothetical protein